MIRTLAFTLGILTVVPVAAAAQSKPPLSRIIERATIVPRVDHHQHIVGPRATIPWPALAPAPTLPPGLQRVVDERNRIMGTDSLGGLYADNARILHVAEEARPWVSGRDALGPLVRAYDPTTRFVPQSYAAGDSVAQVFGIAVTPGPPETRMNFVLGLRKDTGGTWRIETEQATPVPPPPFAVPLTGDQLVRDLDETGIERAVVLSVAYFFASPSRSW